MFVYSINNIIHSHVPWVCIRLIYIELIVGYWVLSIIQYFAHWVMYGLLQAQHQRVRGVRGVPGACAGSAPLRRGECICDYDVARWRDVTWRVMWRVTWRVLVVPAGGGRGARGAPAPVWRYARPPPLVSTPTYLPTYLPMYGTVKYDLLLLPRTLEAVALRNGQKWLNKN